MASLSYTDYLIAARSLNCEVAAIRAVADVESSGAGFDLFGNIKKRFEAHLFLRETGYSVSSYEAAYQINPTEAIRSTSWGKFQVLGSNHAAAGYHSPAAMVADYRKNEQNQLSSWVKLIKSWELQDELRRHDWHGFAAKYNGRAYKASYPARMEDYYRKYAENPQQELLFGYNRINTIGLSVLLVLVLAVGLLYAHQTNRLKRRFLKTFKLRLP